MHPRIREILDYLNASHAELARAVRDVPEALREKRPAPDRWSAAEVIEHLALVEERIAGTLAGPLASAARLAEERDTSPVLPRLAVDGIRDRSKPLVASEASLPKGQPLQASWEALEERREMLRRAVLAADGRALGEVRHVHPRLGELDLYQWLIFVGAHESRHAGQIREIAQTLRGS